ncbi:MAG: hypothetical protein A3J10_02445 [Candidatus Sungbacteria bacterium RIFCSPLOWO2_02_FULL_54_10]|uniref:Polymerase beta nucleotidyltransferase domain-containing protein n=2 Tax=Candidatus Sungiibacteriota TaxID=1817917 RepID=A0A1G2L4H9_9BACT|nr:MAG: hypothetical protein A2679_02300 [Candidatus Sungbacteria bacterium RIFCSPHIGHO2_01_FULL_54_26]OHA03216.1 MAG: hypothetical protein A3C92_01755 [Candidatus Sungbacteria bacterium RIFCSPHIGHO2_02_FULL_53_17]OHA06565.1 MAG: hypothetical protein A3B34_01495 [Candidatus Sungbacteria bacterium RIFCSPLOWO2_01_FULL_54_21]OHA13793.1 MAG: hypothetical protein A3J10_02445 [Candidatus Sungbacteria bacterium RIFCSPLOWO2_02_FULL_54_10]
MEMFSFSEKEKEILHSAGIEALVLFGSRARGTEGSASDFDVGVLFGAGHVLVPSDTRTRVYNTLYDLLSLHAGRARPMADIDIVFLGSAPMELQSHVATHGVSIYEEHPLAFARFRERVMDVYADFAPLRRIFHEAILARIP